MTNFKLSFAPDFDDRVKEAALAAATTYTRYLKDDVTISLSFASSSELPSFVNGAAFNNEVGGYGADQIVSDRSFREALHDDNLAAGDAVSKSAYNSITRNWESTLGSYNGLKQGNRYNSRINDSDFNQIVEVRMTNANAKALKLEQDLDLDYGTVDSHIVISEAFLADNPTDKALESLILHEIAHGLGFVSEVDSISDEFGDRILAQAVNFQASHEDQVIVDEQRKNFTPLDYFRFVRQTNGTANTSDDTIERSLFPERWLQSGSYFSYDGGKTNHADLEEGKFTNGSAHRIDELTHASQEYLLSLKSESFQGAHLAKSEASLLSPVHNGVEYGLGKMELDILNAIGWDVDYNGNSSGGQVSEVAWTSDVILDAEKALHALRTGRVNSRYRWYLAESGDEVTAFDPDAMTDALISDLYTNRLRSVWVEAEDYTSAKDNTPGNLYGAYRDGDVDISTQANGTIHTVGHIYAGESLTYAPQAKSGKYDLVMRVASKHDEARTVDVVVGDRTYTSPVFRDTANWHTYQEVVVEGVNLTDADEITFEFSNSRGFNFDSFELVYKGAYEEAVTNTVADLPRIEAEDFAWGKDFSPGNAGGAYRNVNDVDIESNSHGGHNVGWIEAGESLTYKVNSPGGTYDLVLSVASDDWSAKTISVVVNGQTYTSNVFSNTGDWQNYQDIVISSVPLDSGINKVRVVADDGNFNFDALQFVAPNSANGVVPGERFNLGGSSHSDSGKTWHSLNLDAANHYDLGSVDEDLDTEQLLARTGAYAPDLTFSRSVANGKYEVTIGLPEVIIDNSDERVMDVEIEGKSYIDSLYLAANDFASVYAPSFVVDVVDGVLDIDLTAKVNDAALAFVDIVPTDAPLHMVAPAFLAPATYHLIEAEDYVDGWDKYSGNELGAYRSDDVDIESNPHGGYNVGAIDTSEWLDYDFNLAASGKYDVVLKVASASSANKSVDVTIAGQTITSPVFNHTGGWQDYHEVVVSGFDLEAGIQNLGLDFTAAGFNLDSIKVLPTASNSIRLEAEDYVDYKDLHVGNEFGQVYRDGHVDIMVNSKGGYSVGATEWGESLAYDVNLAKAGFYDITLSVASGDAEAGVAEVEVDGQFYTTPMFAHTGSWDSYKEITIPRVPMAQGLQPLQLHFLGKSFDVDYIDIEPTRTNITSLGTTRIEAESMERKNYRLEQAGHASNDILVSLAGGNGQESGHLYHTVEESGTYNVEVATYDEADGNGSINFFVNSQNYGGFVLDDNSNGVNQVNAETKIEREIARNVYLKAGDRLEFVGVEEYYESAAIDYINLEQIEVSRNQEQVIGEFGKVARINHNSQTIMLDNRYDNPVVFALPPSMNGGAASIVRITDIKSDRFTAHIQEANYEDGRHANESFSYLVAEAGTWELADGTLLEVGSLNTNKVTTQGWQSVSFEADFEVKPVVLSQVQTDNGADFVKTRQKPASVDGFELTMEEEEALKNTGHATETVGWLAIEPGAGSFGDLQYQADTTGRAINHNFSEVEFDFAFDNDPALLASVSSYYGADPVGLRYQDLSASSVSLMLQEDTSRDSEIGHTNEAVDYLAFAGTGDLTAVAF